MTFLRLAGVLLLMVPACSGNTRRLDVGVGNDAPGVDAPSVPTDTPVDVRADVGGACAAVEMLGETCSADTDCRAGIHVIDCCGSRAWIGYTSSELTFYIGLENECQASYPDCDCLPMPTVTDSGEMTDADDPIVAGCVGGRCVTYFMMRPDP